MKKIPFFSEHENPHLKKSSQIVWLGNEPQRTDVILGPKETVSSLLVEKQIASDDREVNKDSDI